MDFATKTVLKNLLISQLEKTSPGYGHFRFCFVNNEEEYNKKGLILERGIEIEDKIQYEDISEVIKLDFSQAKTFAELLGARYERGARYKHAVITFDTTNKGFIKKGIFVYNDSKTNPEKSGLVHKSEEIIKI